MYVAQSLNVGEHLVGAGARRRAGRCEGIADQHDAALAVSVADVEIDRPDFDIADRKSSDIFKRPGNAVNSVSSGD